MMQSTARRWGSPQQYRVEKNEFTLGSTPVDFLEQYSSLGNTFLVQNNLGAAIENYRKALELKPDFAEIHCNMGLALQLQGNQDAAIESYRRAILFKPDFAGAHNNLGLALRDRGNLDAAVESYRTAVALQPDFADAHYNLGIALKEQGKLDEAIASYRQALSPQPNLADGHYNLGNALQDQGKLDEAVISYHQTLLLKPDYAEAHNNLGNVLQLQNKLDNSIVCYQKALELKPDLAEAHNSLGSALQNQGKLNAAAECYRKALSFKPDYTDAYSNLLFLHSYRAFIEPQEYLSLARGWEQACLSAMERQAAHTRTFSRLPTAGRRLRVGYVSGDFRQHAVSYFIEQLFAQHDKTKIELFAYSSSGMRDAVTERLQALTDHWIPITGMPDSAVLERIAADGIDVLIDLSGHTRHNRLGVFARRAAPVQAHYLGYFASTGLTEMDYWIGDDILTPPEMDNHFDEQVWRLPRVWVSYKTIADAPEPDWHPASDGSVWIGSFNGLGKITPQTIALWAKVLHALPEGRLLLKAKDLADTGNRQRVLDDFADHGIPADRIELQRDTDWADYMAQYNRLDIALDPVGGHSGGTTTCDTLWMGVPVIHALGNRATSRFTASMLNAIGHPEWIAQTEAEYVDKVVALARDVEQRKTLRPAQRAQMANSPLCNAKELVVNLERAYFEMFERWMQKAK